MGCLMVFRVSTFLYTPSAARYFSTGSLQNLQALSRTTGFIMMISLVPVLILTVVFGGPILGRVFGADYAGAWVLLAWLLCGYISRGIVGPGEHLLQVAGKQNTVLALNSLFLCLMLIGVYFFGRACGVVATTIVVATCNGLLHTVYLLICYFYLGIRTDTTFRIPEIRKGLMEL